MVDLTVLPGFITAIVLILIAPGPDMAYMVAVGLEGGRRAAATAILGVCTGMCVYTVAVVAGLGTLVGSHPWLLTVLKSLGAVYLLWLGVSTLKNAKSAVKRPRELGHGKWYRRGVLVSLTNPKIVLFFLAFLPQFIGDAHNPALQLALLGGIDVIIEMILYGSVGVLAGVFHTRFDEESKVATALNIIACIVYFLLAAIVILDLLPL